MTFATLQTKRYRPERLWSKKPSRWSRRQQRRSQLYCAARKPNQWSRTSIIELTRLEKALSKLNLPQHQQEVLERMSLSLVRKLLAQPVVNLREAAKKGDSKLLTVAGQIFEGE